MNYFKLVILILICAIVNYSCTATKRAHKLPVEEQTSLNYTKPYFQVWNAAIKYKTKGAHIYIPNLESLKNTQIKDVYFRGMKAKLNKGRAIYTATLTKPKFNDGEVNPEVSQEEFPFDLLKNECVVSYIENGTTKYYLISGILEKEGVYYPNGTPTDSNRN